MRLLPVLLALSLACTARGYYRLAPLSHLQLPTGFSRDAPQYQGLNRQAAIDAAYDFHNSIAYVLGKNHLLNVISILNPAHPVLLFTKQFTPLEGIPSSLAVCDNELAVGFAAETEVHEGHVRFYNTYQQGSGDTDLSLDGYITVGASPDHIQYTENCLTMVIPNEGKPGKDEHNRYVDPEGTVAVMHTEKTGQPSTQHVDFQRWNKDSAGGLYDQSIRQPSLFIPSSVHGHTEFSQDVEPTYAAITPNGRSAWVTLPSNNAVAKIDLTTGLVSEVDSLPLKNWTNKPIDASDRDGGVHRRNYPGLFSLRQPTVVKAMDVGKKTFLFTADTGLPRTYTSSAHTFAWTDTTTARTIMNTIDNAGLKTEASNDEHLGRLQVSSIDGKDMFGQYTKLVTFGGRGFSIWDTSAFSGGPVFDSAATLEEYMEANVDYRNVFNTDYVSSTASYQSPEGTRDAVSDNMGAQVTGLDVKDDNGTTYLVVGTWSTGTLYLYTVNTTSGQPIPSFQSLYRAGVRDMPWNDLYTNKTVGDLYISDITIIPSDHSPIDRPLVMVTSEGAGGMSLYEIEYATASVGGGI